MEVGIFDYGFASGGIELSANLAKIFSIIKRISNNIGKLLINRLIF
jgi:hypothetical protein